MPTNIPRCRLAVFVSGGGSNLQAIIDKSLSQQLNAEVVVVICDKASAYGLERAKTYDIDNFFINPKDFANKHDYESHLIDILRPYHVDIIVLAGFMRVLGETFVEHYYPYILNIHPSLLPKYKGLNTHLRVLENSEKKHGTTVHLVNNKLDDGEIILQQAFNIENDDNAQSLFDKVQQIEYQLYSQAIDKYWRDIWQTRRLS